VFGLYCGSLARGALLNEPAGHLLRCKLQGVDESGVNAGFACLSSPLLVHDAVLYPPGATAASSASSASSLGPPVAAMKRQRTDADANALA